MKKLLFVLCCWAMACFGQVQPKACQAFTTLQLATALETGALTIGAADEQHRYCTYVGKDIHILVQLDQSDARPPGEPAATVGDAVIYYSPTGRTASQMKVLKGGQSLMVLVAGKAPPSKEQMI